MTNTRLRIGDLLNTAADYDRLPVGTVIGPNGTRSRNTYTKQSDGTYLSTEYHNSVSVGDLEMNGYNAIKTVGTGFPVLYSLAQWQWRFRDNAYQSAEQAGVRRDTVDRAMAELKLTDDMFPIGRGVQMASDRNKELLPIGTIVVQGEPENLPNFGLFQRTTAGWVPILGQRPTHNGYMVTVISGDPAQWALTPGTEADQDAVKQFKAQAWKVGWKVKVGHRWCESYESYMARVGLDESVLRDVSYNGVSLGDKVDAYGAARLPEGTVLRWQSSHELENWTWYVRDDRSSIVARTRAIFGNRTDGGSLRNSARSMEVMWIPDGNPMHLTVHGNDVRQLNGRLPVGTKVQSEDGTEYVVCGDHKVMVAGGRVIPSNGSWMVSDIGSPVIISEFGS